MIDFPIRYAAGDRVMWQGQSCTVEYVADDALLISYPSLLSALSRHRHFKIVARGDVTMPDLPS